MVFYRHYINIKYNIKPRTSNTYMKQTAINLSVTVAVKD